MTAEARRRQLDWIEAELPGEDPELALIAAQMLRFGGVTATRDAILERLRTSGRDQESLAARALEDRRRGPDPHERRRHCGWRDR